MSKIKVKKSDPPETKEVLADAIVRISEGFEKLQKSGLNERAIIALLHDATKIGKPAIRDVLAGLRQLKGWYCQGKGEKR